MGHALAHIITELGLARVRHRALLKTLLDAGVIEWDSYVSDYVQTASRDLTGLTAQLVMTNEAFRQHFGDWKKEDLERYRVVKGAARRTPPKKRAP